MVMIDLGGAKYDVNDTLSLRSAKQGEHEKSPPFIPAKLHSYMAGIE